MVLRELALDSVTGDLQIANGSLAFLSGAAAVAQRVSVRLTTLRGEWTFDTQLGTPWLQEIMDGQADETIIHSIVSKRIRDTEGVADIEALSVDINRTNRTVTITGRIRSDTGDVFEIPEIGF